MLYSDTVNIDGIKYKIEILNARRIKIVPSEQVFPIISKDGNSITLSENFFIKIGNDFRVFIKQLNFTVSYEINAFEIFDNNTIEIITNNFNISTRFILPLLGGNRETFLYNKYLMNCYLGDKTNTTYESKNPRLFLQYRFFPYQEYLQFEETITKSKRYIGKYDRDEKTVIFVMELPNSLYDDFKFIINGQYSKLSKNSKNQILNFHNLTVDSLTAKALYKHPSMRKQLELDLGEKISEESELYEKPDVKDEFIY